MLGTSIAVVVFLVLVVPGMVYQFTRERRGHAPRETPFRESARVLIAGLGFTAVALSVLLTADAVRPGVLPDIDRWIGEGNAYLGRNYRAVIAAVVVEAILACLIAAAVGAFVGRGDQAARYRAVSPWRLALIEDCPNGALPYVSARTAAGTRLSGYVRHWQAVSEDDAVLVLWGPNLNVKPKDQARVPLDDWDRVVLRLSEVVYLQVAYRPEAAVPPT